MATLTIVQHSSLCGFWNTPAIRDKANKEMLDKVYVEFDLKNKRIEEDYQKSRWNNIWNMNSKIDKLKQQGLA